MEGPNPLCLALDSSDAEEVARLAAATERHVGVFKVGLTSFVSFGSYLTRSLAKQRPVFLDLKLHDIPQQVAGAVSAVAGTGAVYVTIHAGGGPEMVSAAADAAGPDVTILAVTVLTSLDDESLRRIGIEGPSEEAVLRLAELALGAGAKGLVCSPLEVAKVRSEFGQTRDGGPLLVVPGIRPVGSSQGDQRRTLGPREAIEAGADMIVVGRPITAAPDPAAAAEYILKDALAAHG